MDRPGELWDKLRVEIETHRLRIRAELDAHRSRKQLVDRLYLFLPSFDSGEDAVWACGPHEGFGVGIGLGDEVDGVLKVGDGSKHAAFEAPICELGEEAFDGIEP